MKLSTKAVWISALALFHFVFPDNISAAEIALYQEPYRPQYHFSPPQNWMNDPNGLVFCEGEFHLFYQFNPLGIKWGHMSWGHAVSTNLVTWKHLPVAIPEQGNVMAFSGSAVVDEKNTSGFGDGITAPIVAVYTGHETKPVKKQSQYLAYSNDHGRTWKEYAGNPVLDLNLADFRDPKVSWYAPGGCWIMTVVLSTERKVAFYRSENLRGWTLLSQFGPAGSTSGVWECPDLFPLVVQGDPTETKWVLIVNVGDGAPNGGSGSQYFVGNFDGKTFTPEKNNGAIPTRWLDHGRDFYAAVTWSNVPGTDGRRLLIGWMNNWKYAQDIPTQPWRSVQSLVRELGLVRDGTNVVLTSRPIEEYVALRTNPIFISGRSIPVGETNLKAQGLGGDAVEIKVLVEPGGASETGFTFFAGPDYRTQLGYDVKRGTLFIDRTKSGPEFHQNFAGRHEVKLPLINGSIGLHIFLDHSTLEVFADDGRAVISDQIFAPEGYGGITMYSVGASARLNSLQAWHLSSIWRDTADVPSELSSSLTGRQ